MSSLRVNNLRGVTAGSSPTLPEGVVVTGVATATTFDGNLTGNVTGNIVGDVTGDVTGNITGTAGTFSGDLSIDGTLTYEDVTNIDSVGVVTARSGIKVGAGQSISAVSGTLTYYGDGSQLTGISAAGDIDFVASGTISNGDTVVINTDGTVGIVTQTTGNTPSLGSAVVFESARVYYVDIAYDSNAQKVVIAYADDPNSRYGTAVVGTVSGTSISFGTPVVYNSGAILYNKIAFDASNNKVVIAYRDGAQSDHGKAIVGTVSGTSISFGSEVTFESSTISDMDIVYDSNAQKVVIAYELDSNGYGKAVVGTVSGTSISFGSKTTFEDSNIIEPSATFDSSNNKVVIGYTDQGDSNYGKAVVGTVSGTSISFGTPVTFESRHASSVSCTFDSSNNKVVIAFRAEDNSNYGTAVVGTVSGTSISFGSQTVYRTALTNFNGATFDSNLNKVVIAYQISGGGKFVVGTVSGTSISFGSETDFSPGSSASYTRTAFDSSNNKVVICWQDGSNGDHGTARVLETATQTTNLTAENYIGIAAEAISNAATGKITIFGGTNSGQTGLTAGQTYYVQNDGTLGTSADDPSVVAGTSISTTQIIVKG